MSLEEQKVVVKGDVAYEIVLEKIKKTGKEVGCVVGRVLFSFANLVTQVLSSEVKVA